MGTKIPKYGDGLTCAECYGTGKPFGPGPGPKYVHLYFSGINEVAGLIPPPPHAFNDDAALLQYSACEWRTNYQGLDFVYKWYSTRTVCAIYYAGMHTLFYADIAHACRVQLSSSIIEGAGNYWWGGSVEVVW